MSSSGERQVQKVLKSFGNPNVGRIVLHGVGGAGKTWTARHAMDQSVRHRLFDTTIWVSLSADSTPRQAQKKIMERLSIPPTAAAGDNNEAAEQCCVARDGEAIHRVLSGTKFLLVLDDVWFKEDDPLGLIGIPSPRHPASVAAAKGSKILITTGSLRVLKTTEPDVWIGPAGLPLLESWMLFCESTGGDAVHSPAVQPLVRTVIERCSGMPLAIKLVGGALRGTQKEEDSSTVTMKTATTPTLESSLRTAVSALGTAAVDNMLVHRAAKLGYHMLPNDTARECLLYCGLFSHNRGIHDYELTEYWVLEGFFLDATAACAMLAELINRNLLCRDNGDDNRIRMHNVVREVVSDLGGRRRRGTERIALTDTPFEALSGRPRLRHELAALLLEGNQQLTAIPDAFINQMTTLKVLDLSHTRIKHLPYFLFQLDQLRVLLLRGCDSLEEVVHIDSLENLEVLDLSGATPLRVLSFGPCMGVCRLEVLNLSETSIEGLPFLVNLRTLRQLLLRGCRHLKTELYLESLTELEVLDLSGTTLVGIPYGISKLARLRHIHLLGTKYTRLDWQVIPWLPGGLSWDQRSGSDITTRPASGKAFISANDGQVFQSLDKDSPLWGNSFQRFHFSVCPSASSEDKCDDDTAADSILRFQKEQFVFRDAYFKTRHFPHPVDHDRCLEICDVQSFPHGVEGVLHNAELVSLNNVRFMKRLSDLGLEHVKGMRECWIERCDQMDTVLLEEEDVEFFTVRGSLERLWISNLTNLRFLVGEMGERGRSFAGLKHLNLDCCPNLVSVFSSALLRLVSLETFQIKFCDNMESVFFGDSVVPGEDALPRLHTLRLWELPRLKSIIGEEGVLPALKNLKVRGCPLLTKIPVGINETNPLVVIRGESSWWNSLRWADKRIKSHQIFRRWGSFEF